MPLQPGTTLAHYEITAKIGEGGMGEVYQKLLTEQGCEPRRLVTDKLRSYSAALRTVMPSVVHCTDQYANNRAEISHQPPGSASARCGASNPPPTCSGSCPCTASCRISFEWVDICYGPSTTGC